jgi:putative acetyltransferase
MEGIMIEIRNETEAGHKAVEEITRKAFYTLFVPDCFEHIWSMLCGG